MLENLGEHCKGNLKPIKSSSHCKVAQEWLQKNDPALVKSKFITASGNGTDLPRGCVYDVVSRKHYVYWNPEGKVLSADPKLRSICEKRKQGEYVSQDFI